MNGVVQNFGCNKIRRSANVPWLCFFVVHCEAEIAKFGDISMVEKDVTEFEVTMDNTLIVNVLQGQRDLTNNFCDLVLRYLKVLCRIQYGVRFSRKFTCPCSLSSDVRLLRSHNSNTKQILTLSSKLCSSLTMLA